VILSGAIRLQDPQGQNVIAQLMITFEWSDWRASDVWWIQSVYVHPEYRRKGLFRALYQHAKTKSQQAGACGLRLYADDSNIKAQETVRLPDSKLPFSKAVVDIVHFMSGMNHTHMAVWYDTRTFIRMSHGTTVLSSSPIMVSMIFGPEPFLADRMPHAA
jgi:GNAT superfamily N-acetyltransferase